VQNIRPTIQPRFQPLLFLLLLEAFSYGIADGPDTEANLTATSILLGLQARGPFHLARK
jgi:hypothetical protein